MILQLARGRRLDLSGPRVMGILNATPDSFSDGGAIAQAEARDTRIRDMLDAGADILDIGGESTRPGHQDVPAKDEIARVVPVIEAVRAIDAEVPISVDTRKATVAEAALAAGADFVNDVSGLADPDMVDVVHGHATSIVLMRNKDLEGEIVAACRDELTDIVARADRAGIEESRLVLDPGLGFGKRPGASPEDNLALIRGVSGYAQGLPVLIGASRKRFLGQIAGEAEASRRVGASVAAALLAVKSGARIVRVHDVRETVQALAVWRA